MRFNNPVPAEHVKQEAERRITARDAYPIYKQLNIGRKRGAEFDAMSKFIDDVRDASDRIEAMKPIPPDFRNDKYWPAMPKKGSK